MDDSVLFQLSYGMYAITAMDGDRPIGCIVNTACQFVSEPPILTVSVHRDNYTNQVIKQTKQFALSILSEETSRNTVAFLGFQSARDKNKFDHIPYKLSERGQPLVTDHCCGYIECEVIDVVEVETHTLFIGKVVDAVAGTDGVPMTYDYYHTVFKGKAPKNAPTYQK